MGSRSEFKVLKTTPLQPASKERATISALLETGDDDSRNGFLNFMPQKSTDKSIVLVTVLPPDLCARWANYWNRGILECWNDGKIGILSYLIRLNSAFFTQYSIIPSFHYSISKR